MNTSVKLLFACLLTPLFLLGQKMQDKSVWQFDLQFDFAKSDLRTEYHPRLDSLAVALQDSTFVVSMTAHTDAVGDAKANFELSQKRAQTVKSYLMGKNAPENRIHTEGFGESQPIAENQSEDGKQRNRRVSVSVLRRLAQVSGTVKGNDGKTPVVNTKVVLLSRNTKDSVLTDANGAYSLTTRLNTSAKIIVVPNPSDKCPLYDGLIFTVNQWTMTQNVQLKCTIKPAQTITSTTPIVTPKRTAQKVLIAGFVTNDSAKNVKNARLIFSNDLGRDTVYTDKNGHYSVTNMMYSDVYVSISANNHLPFYKSINADSATKKVNFTIQTISVGKKATLQNINFYYGSYEVMTESEASLADLVQFMTENATCRIEVCGHITSNNPITYPIDNIEYDLSYNRAKAIYQFLIDKGIKAERMTYKGYSNYEMIFQYPKDEAEHRANRRVEIKIISDNSK